MMLRIAAVGLCSSGLPLSAVTFTNNARLEVNTSALDWNPANNGMLVSCWFKLSIPSETALTENMTILANRRSGSQSDRHAYWIQFNVTNGAVEFSSRGSAGIYTNTLIDRPYLERWYHVAIVRPVDNFSCYLDGRAVPGGGG
ncbi:MAG TPA: LamG-like jellyroll fold domain-containing protein, partial [Methylomirabilota bacterium]|nr:LamG-like jellyroll fold domain-containing protein [Methylomirabilota bacterium]